MAGHEVGGEAEDEDAEEGLGGRRGLVGLIMMGREGEGRGGVEVAQGRLR